MKPLSCFLSVCASFMLVSVFAVLWGELIFPFLLGEGIPRVLEMCPGALRTSKLSAGALLSLLWWQHFCMCSQWIGPPGFASVENVPFTEETELSAPFSFHYNFLQPRNEYVTIIKRALE